MFEKIISSEQLTVYVKRKTCNNDFADFTYFCDKNGEGKFLHFSHCVW